MSFPTPTTTSPAAAPSTSVVAIAATAGERVVLVASGLTELAGTSLPTELDAAWLDQQHFSAKAGEVLALRQPGAATVLIVGVGSGDPEGWRSFGAAAVRHAGAGATLALVVGEAEAVEDATVGALLATYRFDRHRSGEPKAPLGSIVVVTDAEGAAQDVDAARVIAEAVHFAKDLINEPAGHLPPRELAERALQRCASKAHTTVEVWDGARIVAERCGALQGVAKGSIEEPRLVIARYEPEGATDDTFHAVLVGKGVTFDSGGLSLKTGAGMMTMKTDMTGAAVVLATVAACAELGVAVKVTAIAPMAENMPSGTAMRPGDVLTARNGTTIEVLNTDAEGRLLLADALSLGAELNPDVMIDYATLTGAQVVALGDLGARYCTDDDLDADLERSITVVEWGEGLVEQLSVDRLVVRITADDDDARTVTCEPVGARWAGAAVPACD